MNHFLFFFILVLIISCKGDRTEYLGEIEIIFHNDGRTSAYIGEDNFKIQKARLLNSEGISLAKDGFFQKAKFKFHNGLELEPENPTLLNNLGNAEHKLKNYYEAISYFEQSLKISDSLYLNASLNLGLLYWKDYEFEKSSRILEYTISKSTNEYEKAFAHLQLAKTYLDMNKCEKSKIALDRAKNGLKEISGFEEKLKKLASEIKNCVQHK